MEPTDPTEDDIPEHVREALRLQAERAAAPPVPLRGVPPEEPSEEPEPNPDAFRPEDTTAFEGAPPVPIVQIDPSGAGGAIDPEQALNRLLEMVVVQGASDLHLVGGSPPLLRIVGDLVPVQTFPSLTPATIEAMVGSMLTEEQREHLARDLELDCARSLPNARFRVNVHFQRGSMAAAFRLIPFSIQSVEELGLPAAVKDLARLRRGLVVVTGPTGSGKSTTLAAMLDIVNSERRAHVLTVEDPIEFLHRHRMSAVSQREVGYDTRGFAPALKHALRQDPDVIMVGEMRDLETIATAITAAETGHLVLATLHTQDAPQAVDRIVDVFPSHQQQQIRVQLSITLQGVVAQQLLPAADGRTRVVACEVLMVTPAVRNLIREAKTHQIYSAMQSGRKIGMQTMDAHLAQLVTEGRITKDVAFERAHNPEELSRLFGSGYAGGLPTVNG